MSIKDLHKAERRIKRKAVQRRRIAAVGRKVKRVLWVPLVLIGSGCGHTLRETGLAAIRVSGAALADTGRMCSNGAKAMGSVGPTGQASDGMREWTPEQIDEIARSLGYVKGGVQ